jgi:arylsulfatase A-like enzyme
VFIFLTLSLLAQSVKTSKPNILIIIADDLGGIDLHSFGSNDISTPNIDALVSSGMKFTNFHSNSSVCSPTRASLLTGRYPDLVGVPGVIRTDPKNSWGYLSKDVQLLPAILKKAGYHTAHIGKWHLGLKQPNLPNQRGFDLFHGFLGDMMDDYNSHLRHNINYMRMNNQEIAPAGHATDIFTDWTVEYIENREKQQSPFFVYLAYNAPHDPIQPPASWIEKVKNREPGITDKRAKLVALVEHMDAGIGKVITALKETGVYNNTIIFFVSDNGGRLDLGANNGKVRSGKGSMYEGGLKVPACITWPGKIKASSSTNELALTMDIFPTILQATGIAYKTSSIDGVSLYNLVTSKTDTLPERVVFFCRREGDAEYGGKMIDAVRKGDWKLLQNFPFAPRELYNLKDDPLEQNNLILKENKQFREMEALMRSHILKTGSVRWQ